MTQIAQTYLCHRALHTLWPALVIILFSASGCQTLSGLRGKDRLENGYTILLPGILGHAPWDDNLAQGLEQGGVPSAIEVVDWTEGPWLLYHNILDRDTNNKKAQEIVAKIIDYQDRYPGRPVHLVGHSGGATMAVQALQLLPPDRRIESAILLAPGMPKDFDLRPAMNHTTSGIHNYYSPYDLLITTMYVPSAMTTFQQNDLRAAGAAGFAVPQDITGDERLQYERSLKQHTYEFEMMQDGHLGDHFGWTNPTFVAKWIAPIVGAPAPDHRGNQQLSTDQEPQPPVGNAVSSVPSPPPLVAITSSR